MKKKRKAASVVSNGVSEALKTLCEGCGAEVPSSKLTEGYCPTCVNFIYRPDYTKASAYRGDSWGKKIARFLMYTTVHKVMTVQKAPGTVILLAGDEAAELECMMAFLGHQIAQRDIVLVDRDIRGLKNAEKKFPGIRTYCGELEKFLQEVDEISYIHLDLCGQFSDKCEKLLKQIGPKLTPGSIVAHTFMRGCESKRQKWWTESVQYGRSYYGRLLTQAGYSVTQRKEKMAAVTDETYARVYGYPYRGAKSLHPKGLAGIMPVRKIRYNSTTPFTILVWVAGRGAPSALDQAKILSRVDLDTDWVRNNKQFYLEHVIGMHQSGIDAKTVGKVLTIAPGSVAAYSACYTQGKYPKYKPAVLDLKSLHA